MRFDFTNFDRPDSIPEEVVTNPVLLKFINDSIDNQVTASISIYEEKVNKAQRDKALADEKVDKLQTALDEAHAIGSGNEEIDKLRAQLLKAKDEASTEYTAQIKALKTDLEKERHSNNELKQKLVGNDITNFLRSAISEHDAKHPAHKTIEGAEKYLIEAGLKAWQKTEDGQFRAYEGDKPLTSGSGFITGPEYIARLRENTDTRLFFTQPSGGGAAGGKGSGAGDKTMTRSEFARLDPAKQASVATTHQIIEG